MIRPTPLALALSRIYGTCFPQRVTALFWIPCPACGNPRRPRMTNCNICGGDKRVAVFA